MSLIEQIDKDRLPQHVAVKMKEMGRGEREKGKLGYLVNRMEVLRFVIQ